MQRPTLTGRARAATTGEPVDSGAALGARVIVVIAVKKIPVTVAADTENPTP